MTLSPLIAPELDQPDSGTGDLRPWRNSIAKRAREHGCDTLTAYGICCYRLGTMAQLDPVLAVGRLRRALDELLAKGAKR